MAPITTALAEYKRSNAANNKITDKGAISLKERSSHWQLTILALSTDREYEDSNKLEDIGCKYLLEGKWSALKILGLCIYFFIQLII